MERSIWDRNSWLEGQQRAKQTCSRIHGTRRTIFLSAFFSLHLFINKAVRLEADNQLIQSYNRSFTYSSIYRSMGKWALGIQEFFSRGWG
jgi:hypothetical protein